MTDLDADGFDRTKELITDWLIEYRSADTRSAYRRDVYQFGRWLGRDPLEAERRDVRRWIAHLNEAGFTDATVRRKASALSSFFTHAVAEGVLDTSPAENVHRPQGESAPRLGLTADRAQKLIAAARDHSRAAHALVWLMAGAGLRVGEACSARIEDLNGDLLTVTVKGRHRQIKPLSPPALEAVRAAVGGRSEGPVVTNRDGGRLTRNRAGELVERLAASAGVDDCHPHVLRHTAATLALEAGVPVEDVSELLGHRSIETTLRYVQNRDVLGGTRRAAQRLASVLRPGTEEA